MFRVFKFYKVLSILVFFGGFSDQTFAQELEPRLLTTLPVGTNFTAGAYAYTVGDITHVTPDITTINFERHTFLLAYLRSFNFFGMSAKIGAVIPLMSGKYNAIVRGVYQEFSYTGLSDPILKLSFNFIGSPATKMTTFRDYKPNLIAGFSLLVSMPFGQYDKQFFINPGRNSWVVRAQLGIAKYVNQWILECYISTWFISENTAWLGDQTIAYRPLYAIKTHVIRKLIKGAWFSLNAGYGNGNNTSLNNAAYRDDLISTIRLGLTYAKPISEKQSLKIGVQSDIRLAYKYDYTTLVVAYQYRWFDKIN